GNLSNMRPGLKWLMTSHADLILPVQARQTPEARYAAALDRFQPLLHNYLTGGRAWLDHAVTSDRVLVRNRSVVDGTPLLGQYAEDLIRDAVAKGYLTE